MEHDQELEALLKRAWKRRVLVLIMNHDLGALLNLAWHAKLTESRAQARAEEG